MPAKRVSRKAFYSSSPLRNKESGDDACSGKEMTRRPSGDSPEDFFASTRLSLPRRKLSNGPLDLIETTSAGSVRSEKSVRTVESLRSAPVKEMVGGFGGC
jgi:hypothetical protein